MTNHHLNSNSEKSESEQLNLSQIIEVLWGSKISILILSLIFAFVCGVYASEYAPEKYQAETTIILQVNSGRIVDIEEVFSSVSSDDAAINTEVRILQSRKLLTRLVDELELRDDPEFNSSLKSGEDSIVMRFIQRLRMLVSINQPEDTEDAEVLTRNVVKQVRNSLNVNVQANSYIIEISAITSTPEKSELLTNSLARIYLENKEAEKFGATERAAAWLSDRVSEMEVEIAQSRAELQEIKSESSLATDVEIAALNRRSNDLRERLERTSDLEGELSSFIAVIQGILESEADNTFTIAGRDQAQRLALKRILEISGANEDESELYSRAAIGIKLEEAKLSQRRAVRELSTLETAYGEAINEVRARSAGRTVVESKERELAALSTLYESLLARLKETTVQIALQSSDSRVLSNAVPGERIAPKKRALTASGFLFGGVLGSFLTLLRSLYSNRFRTVNELKKFSQYGVLGDMPKIHLKRRSDLLNTLRAESSNLALESFRNLRTALSVHNEHLAKKIVLVSSSIPGEGKTTIAIGLASSYANSGQRVLLIDADLRRRTIGQYFDLPTKFGLSSYLKENSQLESLIIQTQLGVDVLPSGESSDDSGDLFSSQRFRAGLEHLKQQYDLIIIDSPPVAVLPDARVISSLCDAVLYGVRWNFTTRRFVSKGLREFEHLGSEKLLLILSQVDVRKVQRYDETYGAYRKYGY